MAPKRLHVSTRCARLAALLIGLAILGLVAEWFRDGAVGVISIVVLSACGCALAIAAHLLSKRTG